MPNTRGDIPTKNDFYMRYARLAIITLLMGLASERANATVWSVSQMLTNIRDPGIELRAQDGSKLEEIQRSWVVQVATVTEHMAPSYGLSVPKMFITRQEGPNAFVTLDNGTPVMVLNTDMLRLVGDDPNLMAVVIGHELGHLKAGHLTEGRAIQTVFAVIGLIGGAMVDANQARLGRNTQGLGMKLGSVGAQLVNAKFSRDQEREADDLGIRHMAAAGFDPTAAPRLWRLMADQGGGGSGLWLSSHPSNEERYVTLDNLATSLAGTYQDNKSAEKSLPVYADTFPPGRYTSLTPKAAELSEDPLGSYARGRAAYVSAKFDEAYEPLKEAAAAGDERAFVLLGQYEQAGQRGPADFAKAREYFQAGADKGLSTAILALGLQSLSGKGAPRDLKEAARLIGIAEARGDARARGMLSLLFLDNAPYPRDPLRARQLAEKSAAEGDTLGRATLGMMLREGIGGTTDRKRSFALLSLAASESAANTYAQFQLGVSYETGAGTTPDRSKAVELYRKALAGGFQMAGQRLTNLGAKP